MADIDFRGLAPQQMNDIAQLALAVSGQRQQSQQFQQQLGQRQLEARQLQRHRGRQAKLALLGQMVDQKYKQDMIQLEHRKTRAMEQLRASQSQQAKAEMEAIQWKQNMLQSAAGTVINTDMGEISGARLMALTEMGLPIKPAERKMIGDPWTKEDGKVVAMFSTPDPNAKQPFTVEEITEFEGAERSPMKEVQLSPGERARQVGEVKAELEATRDPEWINDRFKEFQEQNTQDALVLRQPRESITEENLGDYREATQRYTQFLEKRLSDQLNAPVKLHPGGGGYKPGFYTRGKGGKPKWVRSAP